MLLRRPHELAHLFRDARARWGWSQSELAERAGVSRQWVSLVETGKTSVEFDLVLGSLQELGYRLSLESEDRPEGSAQGASQRTPLTRDGDPLGVKRTRRPSKASDPEDGPSG